MGTYNYGDERLVLALWRPVEYFLRWWISGERERSEGIHDQIDPE